MSVVHPAYHCGPNGGNGTLCEEGRLWLSWMRVLANSAGYVIAISTAPAVEPAMMERRGLGLSGAAFSLVAAGGGFEETRGGAVVDIVDAERG